MAVEQAELALEAAEKLLGATLFMQAAQALMSAKYLWHGAVRVRKPSAERAAQFQDRCTKVRERIFAAKALAGHPIHIVSDERART